MAESHLIVEGYSQLARALHDAPKDVQREARAVFALVGKKVRDDGEKLFSSYGSAAAGSTSFGGNRASHADSAQGYRVRVRTRGVEVEQTKRKTTGRHPEYGAAQMRHGLLPALAKNTPVAYAATEAAMRDVAAIIERKVGKHG